MARKITEKQILNRAAKIIVERGWTRGTVARRKNRHACSEQSPAAASFCAVGAILRAYTELGFNQNDGDVLKIAKRMALEEIRARNSDHEIGSIAHFNDHVAKDAAEVAKALRGAARRAA